MADTDEPVDPLAKFDLLLDTIDEIRTELWACSAAHVAHKFAVSRATARRWIDDAKVAGVVTWTDEVGGSTRTVRMEERVTAGLELLDGAVNVEMEPPGGVEDERVGFMDRFRSTLVGSRDDDELAPTDVPSA